MAKKDKKISTECLKSFKLENQFPWEWGTDTFSDVVEKTYKLFDIDNRYYKFDVVGRKLRNLLMYTDNMNFFDIRHIIEFCSNTMVTQYVIHDEAFMMLLYLRFQNDKLEEFKSTLIGLTIFSFIPAYIFKLWTLNQLPEDQKKVFDKCQEIMMSKGVYPKHHESSREIKVLTFLEMFYGYISIHSSEESVADQLNQLFPNYREEMINYYIDLLPNNMKSGYDLIQSIDKLVVLLYKAMNCIKNKEDADEFLKLTEAVKDNDVMYERMTLLGHIIHDSYDVFEEVKDEACKKYPDIAEYIRSSASLTFLNVLGKIEKMQKGMKCDVNANLYEEMDNSDVTFKSSAITTSSFSRYEGGSAPVTYSIDNLLDSLMEDYPGLEYDDIMENIRLTLRHEMGHVVAHVLKVRNQSSSDYIFPASALSKKIKAKEMERRKNDPEIKKLHHTVWYYSYLPEERKANALMGLTIEDMIKGNFEEITPELREQIASIDIHKIEVEEQKMLLEL